MKGYSSCSMCQEVFIQENGIKERESSEIHKGKSIILKASARELRDLLRQRNRQTECCWCHVTWGSDCHWNKEEMTQYENDLRGKKTPCHSHSKEQSMTAVRRGDYGEVFITAIEDRINEDVYLDRDFINLHVKMHLTAGNNRSLNEWW